MYEVLIDGFLSKAGDESKREALHRKVDAGFEEPQTKGVVRKTTYLYPAKATGQEIDNERKRRERAMGNAVGFGVLAGLLPAAALAYYTSRKTPGNVLSKVFAGAKRGLLPAIGGTVVGGTAGGLTGAVVADKRSPEHLKPTKTQVDYFTRSYQDGLVGMDKNRFKKVPGGLRETVYDWDYDM